MKNLAKKALAMLCVLSMLFSLPVAVYAADFEIAVGDVDAVKQGVGTAEVEVPIEVSGNTGILGMKLEIAYDEGLTLKDIERGEALSTLEFTNPAKDGGDLSTLPAGEVNLLWDGQEGADTSNGVIAVLTFEVSKETVKDYAIEIDTNGVYSEKDEDGKPIIDVFPDFVDGVVSVIETRPEIAVSDVTVDRSKDSLEGVEVPITISDNTGVLGMKLEIAFPEELTLTDVKRGDALSKLAFTSPFGSQDPEADDDSYGPNVDTPEISGSVNLLWDGKEDADAEKSNGTIAILVFTVPDAEAEYDITIGTNGVFDFVPEEIEVDFVDGSISVTGEAPHVHEDDDNNHMCDTCGEKLSECADTNSDHNCDVCGTKLTDCADNNSDHKCDVCGDKLSDCVDADDNNKCDICGGVMCYCEDKDNDHNCDYCGDKLTDCADTNSDHNCDVCGTKLSECADNDSDHNCDVCGTKLSDCADNDSDHNCDVCGTKLSECADNDSDHNCDVCGTKLSECADNDSDHKCDVCGTKLSDHSYKGNVTLNPTHTKDGVMTYRCICGDTYTEAIKATGHVYGEWEADYGADTHSKHCMCNEEGNVVTEVHTWGEGVVTKPATHTVDGTMKYTCTVCSGTKTEVIKAEGHKLTFVAEVAATCTENGTKAHYICTVDGCGKTFADSEAKVELTNLVIPLLGHAYGDWGVDGDNHKKVCSRCGDVVTEAHAWNAGKVVSNATHFAAGSKLYTCTVCNHTKTEEIPQIPHAYDDWAPISAENHSKYCAGCGDVVTEAHTWDNGVVTKPATHTVDGTMKYTCTVCSGTKTEVIKAEGHKLTFKAEVAATCTENGTKAHYICTVDGCGKTFADSEAKVELTNLVIPSLGHAYGDWVVDGDNHKKVCSRCGDVVTEAHAWNAGTVTTPATHFAAGSKLYTCPVCNHTKTEVLPQIPHAYDDWAPISAENHSKYCAGCGDEVVEAHTWDEGEVIKAATHTVDGIMKYTCTVCSGTKTETIKAEGHKTTFVAEVSATCTENGTKAHYICSGCDVKFANAEATVVLTDLVIPSLGHSYGSWIAGGVDHRKECSECGDLVIESHKWDAGKVIIPATHTQIGRKEFTCTVCGNSQTEVIPQIPHAYGDWFGADDENHSKTCSCGDEITEPHTYDDGVITKQPTETVDGRIKYTCDVCGYEKIEVIPALGTGDPTDGDPTTGDPTTGEEETDDPCETGHSFGEGVVRPATHFATGLITYTCDVCGEKETEIIPQIPHAYGEWEIHENEHSKTCSCGNFVSEPHTYDEGVVTLEPTATEDGVMTYTCTACGHAKTEVIPATGTGDPTDGDPTTGDPTTGGDETDDPCETGHAFDAGIITKRPTHFAEGLKTYTCFVCGEVETEVLPQIPHAYGDWEIHENEHRKSCTCGDFISEPHAWDEGVVTKEATATEDGVKTFTCTVCGHTKTEVIPALGTGEPTDGEPTTGDPTTGDPTTGDPTTGDPCETGHTYDAGIITQRPTHFAAGIKTYTCEVCGETMTEIVPQIPHAYGDWEIYENEHSKTCSCGDFISEPHAWDEGVVTKEPTSTEDGIKTFTCTVCGHTKTEVLPSTGTGEPTDDPCEEGHTWNDGVVTTPATCLDGVKTFTCTVCGETKTEVIPATGVHTWDEGVITKRPTHFASGIKTFTCDVCYETYTEIVPMVPHAYGEWTIYENEHRRSCSCGYVEKEAHAHDKWEIVDDNAHKDVCKCGFVIATEEHTWDEGVVTKEPTATETGVKTFTCTACEHTKTEEIPATGTGDPTTGDPTTGDPTTGDPTTGDPTTGDPTTGDPTTGDPTTGDPTTGDPTTGDPTTGDPTTGDPTTGDPTTGDPTTGDPTTGDPTTGDPTTGDPTTGDPTTGDPTTGDPTTGDPTTGDPTTGDPTTGDPTTGDPTTGDPTTGDPTTGDPTTGDPTTGDPTTGDPTTGDPTTGDPTTGDPTTGDPTDDPCETGHTYDEGVVTTPATCTEDGVKTYTCTVCGETYTEVIPAKGHTYGDFVADGDVHKKVCSCGDVVTEAHAYDEGVVTKEPTATEEGIKTYTCTVCGNTKTTTLPATGTGEPTDDPCEEGHTWNEGVVTTPATCAVDGVKTFTCTVCGEQKTEVIPATGVHTYDEGVVTTPATCTEDGVKTFTCTVCGTTYTEVIPAKGHSHGDWAKEDDDNHAKTCACGDVIREAHTWDDGVVTLEPTYTAEGIRTYTCSVCNGEKTETIAKKKRTGGGSPSSIKKDEDKEPDEPTDPTDPTDKPVNVGNFVDIQPSDWFYSAIEFAVENGLMFGTADDKFDPHMNTTRGMIVTVLYRLEGSPAVEGGNATFGDVVPGAYYYDAVIWGQKNGIIYGFSEAEYGPDVIVTREQLVAIMQRYAEFKGYDVSVRADISGYSDAEQVSDWALENVKYGVGSGLIQGRSESTINPLDNAMRAEFAAIMMRFVEMYK